MLGVRTQESGYSKSEYPGMSTQGRVPGGWVLPEGWVLICSLVQGSKQFSRVEI